MLENFKHAVMVLCPKIKSGDEVELDLDSVGRIESVTIKGEGQRKKARKINGKIIVAPFEDFDKPVKNIEDDDTKAGELEIVTKGHPDDA